MSDSAPRARGPCAGVYAQVSAQGPPSSATRARRRRTDRSHVHAHHLSRWWWAACVLLVARCAAAASHSNPHANVSSIAHLWADGGEPSERTIIVSAVVASGERAAGDALAALATAALLQRGLSAAVAPPPPECAGGASSDCLAAALRALVRGAVHAALLAVPASRPPHVLQLRDAGLEEIGDAAPPSRLACFASRSETDAVPRSLLDFADASVARPYGVSSERLAAARRSVLDADGSPCASLNDTGFVFTPEWCGLECATLIAGDEYEARHLAAAAREYRLRVSVLALGTCAARVAAELTSTGAPALICDSALEPKSPLRSLGPPPCEGSDACPFESYRLVKVVNARELAYSPSALRVLGRLALSRDELRALTAGRAAATLARHPEWAGAPGEVRVAVMVPVSSRREAYDADALRAAAALAEEDSAVDGAVRFKVEVLDDGCSATLAFKYLTDALGADYGALSAVAGPACGAAFADVARQSRALSLPVIAYSPQAPPAGGGLTLLAGGDARRHTVAWSALLASMGWRRVAVLSELATRVALHVAELGADVVAHVELPGEGDELDYDLITRWAQRTAAVRGRVALVSVEDARAVRAALCAGRAAGLLPGAGAVWLLPPLPARALRPAPGDRHNCTRAELEATAEGHLSLAPAWLWDWDAEAEANGAWADRWRARRRRLAPPRSARPRPDAHSALLYDALRLWANALRRLLAARPAALDDMHRTSVIETLVRDATSVRYAGLTGDFEWSTSDGARARVSPLALLQWSGGARRRVGSEGAPDAAALRWATADGSAPDDGGERCALQPLADLLRADCRAAFVALGSLALVALAGALGAAACHCKRRAERDYRERLLALGLRTLSPKPGDLDRWETPRERVVINRKLGTGAFGTVYGGHALLAQDRGWTAVAVKTLKAGASTEEKLDFLSEAEAMKRFDHKNVVRLLGVVTKTEPVCTVMEFMLYGDLKNYLLARRHLAGAEGDAGDEVSASRLTGMALDAARALSYLAQLRYVHRDVAARNCLVSARRVLKLADFGMTRLVFENDYYRFSRKGMLPVRWMAPESLALGVFSSASDVWSFGVLLYEMVTFGSLPYQGLSNAEVLARVKAGHTVPLPHGLKPQLEGLIKSCWQQEHKARPSAAEVAAFLADSPRLLSPCLDVPLDALPLDADEPWRVSRDRAEARWVSWAAPLSTGTDTTYLSADMPPPRETDAFLP